MVIFVQGTAVPSAKGPVTETSREVVTQCSPSAEPRLGADCQRFEPSAWPANFVAEQDPKARRLAEPCKLARLVAALLAADDCTAAGSAQDHAGALPERVYLGRIKAALAHQTSHRGDACFMKARDEIARVTGLRPRTIEGEVRAVRAEHPGADGEDPRMNAVLCHTLVAQDLKQAQHFSEAPWHHRPLCTQELIPGDELTACNCALQRAHR